MKKQTFTQSMSWLHTWAGLLFGWALFAIFLTGTLAVFDREIDSWMQPEIPVHQVERNAALDTALAYLARNHAGAGAWNIGLPSERSPGLSVSAGEQRRGGGMRIDPVTGERIEPRESVGGQFFFRFHYTLHMPRNIGIWVVGLAAMAMLVALISGIVIHKKIFKEFFTFRPAKGQRSWLDGHNASAVLLLPFHLMITYTGLVIFFLIYMPAAMDALFDGDREAYGRAARGMPAEQPVERVAQLPGRGEGGRAAPATGERSPRQAGQASRTAEAQAAPAPLTDLHAVLAKAEQLMGPVSGLSIQNPGRANARIEARPILGNRVELTKGRTMQFDGVSGEVLRPPAESRPSQLTQRVMAGLHFAQFGGYPMRWLYFLCGLASCAMIATGLVLYCVKRQRKYTSARGDLGQRLVEALNLASIVGLSLACVGLLWANRLLPTELAGRAAWETRVFFAIWILSLLHAWWRPRQQAWRDQLGATAALCLGLPLLSLLTLDDPWNSNARLYLELTSVASGLLLTWLCLRVARRTQPSGAVRPSAAARRVHAAAHATENIEGAV